MLVTDRPMLGKALIVMAVVIVGFLLHGALHLEPATIALAGATLLLPWTRSEPHHILRDVEWTTLSFFFGLFITVEAVVQVGIIETVVDAALGLTGGNLNLTSTLLLWLSAVASGIVDNIPYTATMIPVVESLGEVMPVEPLWWSLALGACLGGNATLVGASANVVVASLAERSGHPISQRGDRRFRKIPFIRLYGASSSLAFQGLVRTGQADGVPNRGQHHPVLVRIFADEARPGSTIVGRDGLDDLPHYCRQYAPSAKRRSPDAPEGILLWDLKRFARALLEWKAEQDLQDISKDVKRGPSDLVSTRGPDGKYLGLCPGKPPTGFKGESYTLGVKHDGTPRSVQRWVPNHETWDLCRQAWELQVNGASYREIHERTGILGSIGSYATFFRNRIYTGTMVHSGEEYEESVLRLIPHEWFERGQPRRCIRFQHTPRHHASDYLLSGLLHCGHCGGAMGVDSIPARVDAGDSYQRLRYRGYVCLRWKSRRDCDGDLHYVTANALEAAVLDKLVEEVLRSEHLLRVLKDAQPDEETRQSLERERRRLEAKIADTETVIHRLLDAVERSGYSASLEERLGQRERERAELQTELKAVCRSLDETETEVPFDVAADFRYQAREVLDTGNVEDVRALLRTFIVRIEVEDHWGRIIYGFP